MASISPPRLKAWLEEGSELALLDVSEGRYFAAGHIIASRHLPLSLLELEAPQILTRRDVPVVLASADPRAGAASEQVARAAAVLRRLGYREIHELEGGLSAWAASGGVLIDGYNALVKAFGEEVRKHYRVDELSPEALARRLDQGQPTTVVDVRTLAEHQFSTLPGALNYPGTEWPLRDLPQREPDHLWAVHCFSRTRGVIAAATTRVVHGQHVPVAWVGDGVMAWVVQGEDDVRQAPEPDDVLPPLIEADAVARANALIERYALPVADTATVQRWRGEATRNVQCFDLRPGAKSRPGVVAVSGGQLLMHFENLVAVRNASVVLVDEPHRLRSAITAFWLLQLGEAQVYILDVRPDHDLANFEAVLEPPMRLLASSAQPQPVSAAQLLHHIAHAGARVVDVGPSIDYLRGHVPGASYATASEQRALGAALADAVANGQRLVLTSPDGRQALLAARDLLDAARNVYGSATAENALQWLQGGTDAWRAAGQTLETGAEDDRLLTPFLDDWGSIMRVPESQRIPAWEQYLHWERNLAPRVTQDPAVRFRFFD